MNIWDREDAGSSFGRFSVGLNEGASGQQDGHICAKFQGQSATVERVATQFPIAELTDGNAHFLAVIKSGSTVTIMFDGAVQAVSGSVSGNGPYHNNDLHYVGASASLLGVEKFEGYVSEVAFFNSALTVDRVMTHYASSF